MGYLRKANGKDLSNVCLLSNFHSSALTGVCRLSVFCCTEQQLSYSELIVSVLISGTKYSGFSAIRELQTITHARKILVTGTQAEHLSDLHCSILTQPCHPHQSVTPAPIKYA